jgi:hypothetical protein
MSSSRTDLREMPEWVAPTAERFRDEILPTARPAVLRGIAEEWPLVDLAREGSTGCVDMLSKHASGALVEILRADPAEDGRFHYMADGRSLNFIRGRATLPVFLAALREQEASERPYAMAAQGLIADRYVPGFARAHPMSFVPPSAEPRLWIGNAAKVATHNDPTDNVAVVAAGRRRFTLFPPDAEDDLYMGPAHPTPAGAPVSMVHVTAPDFDRFPRYASALESAQEAELSPGDAIFIPRDWFHHVEALESFNVLVNYWWDSSKDGSQAQDQGNVS